MFTASRDIDQKATDAGFRTAYERYASETDTWFDGTPHSVDTRIARAKRLLTTLRAAVARRGVETGRLQLIAELEEDTRVLTALRHDLLNGGADREDTSPIAGVHIAGGSHRLDEFGGSGRPAINPYTGDDEGEFEGNPEGRGHWAPTKEGSRIAGIRIADCGDDEEYKGGEHDKHDEWDDEWDDEDWHKKSSLSPQDRRFVTLESARFLADNADTRDVRELATRAQFHAEKLTSTYDVRRSRAITAAFVASVADVAGSRAPEPLRRRIAAVQDFPAEMMYL